MIIHRRISKIFKKDNTNQNAGLEKKSQYKKIADYVFKGSFIVISLMKYFKEP